MTPVGHTLTSYILAEAISYSGYHLSTSELIPFVIGGNILDLDLITAKVLGKKPYEHHTFFSHTPLFALVLSVAFYFLTLGKLRPIVTLGFLLSMLLHLAMDELGCWYGKIGLQKTCTQRQINWLFPFTQGPKFVGNYNNSTEVFLSYFSLAKACVLTEIASGVMSLYLLYLRFF